MATATTTDASGRVTIRPRGPAGINDVTVYVNSPRGDSLAVGFRWTTRTDGPTNVPKSALSVLAEHSGNIDGYGVDFSISDLASPPKTLAAFLTVTASNGASSSLDVTPKPTPCVGPVGSFPHTDRVKEPLLFRGSTAFGLAAAKLGPPPFTYAIELTMDGVQYTAHAEWPKDQEPDSTPYVSMKCSPTNGQSNTPKPCSTTGSKNHAAKRPIGVVAAVTRGQ